MWFALGSAMDSALKSMAANNLALSVASNNIANADNKDFTRQRLITAPSGSGPMGIGRGVDVVGIDAVRNALVETRLRQEISARSGYDGLTNSLRNVEFMFNDTDDTGLVKTLSDFFNSFHNLSLDPASLNYREEVKVKAEALANAFHSRHTDLRAVQNTATKEIESHLVQINTFTGQIADLTTEINRQKVDHPVHDLRDRRAALVKQLSEIIEVKEIESSTDYQLMTKDNDVLVLNGMTNMVTAANMTSGTGSGLLKAELEVRDEYVPKYLNALDQLAFEISTQVNSIHSGAYNLDGQTGINFFTPLAGATDSAWLIGLSADVSGDPRKVAASSLASGNDNGAALALGNLLHQSVFSGGTVTEQYRSLVFAVGTDVATADGHFREHDALTSQLQNRREAISGVSIDEETVSILQFQRSYEASARLIRVIDELLQVTMSIGG
jgi:flagellar hook-associated protein 1 FlgK